MLDLDEDPKIESPERSTPRGPTPAPVLMAEWLLDRGGGASVHLPSLAAAVPCSVKRPFHRDIEGVE